jgi:hypothetical protein
VAVLAALWTALCFFVILPHFNGGAAGGNYFWQRYSWLGASAGAATANLASHPWLLVTGVLSSAAKRGYIASLLRIGGGLGVFAPLIWIAGLPELAVNLLSTHSEQYSSFFQYSAMLIAFLMAGSVYGAARLVEVRRRVERGEEGALSDGAYATPERSDPIARVVLRLHARLARLWDAPIRRIPMRSAWLGPLLVAWLALTTAWSLAFANIRLADFWAVGSVSIAQQDGIDHLLAGIPPDVSVAATDTLDPHLSDRHTLYLMPDPLSYTAEYVAVDIPDAAAGSRAADAIMYQRMRASGRYEVIGSAYDIVILKRIGPPLDPPPPALQPQPPS